MTARPRPVALGAGSEMEFNVEKQFGILPGTDITIAFDAAAATANTLAAAERRRAILVFPRADEYLFQNNRPVPERVGLAGQGRRSTRFGNLGNNGQAFFGIRGSGISISGIEFDGNRAAQTVHTGGAALVVAKPAALTGSGLTIAGGLLLAGDVDAGAEQITVSALSAVTPLPGDVVSFFDLTTGQYEVGRISDTYDGSITIPLDEPLNYDWTTDAAVSVFSTDNDIHDNTVKAIEFVGIEMWHAWGCKVRENWVRDAEDSGIGVSAQGTRRCSISKNDIESNGKWNIFIDTGDDPNAAGLSGDIDVEGNSCRFLPGGTSFDCIGLAANGAVEGVRVRGNTCDITKAGTSGISFRGGRTKKCPIEGNTIWAGGRAGSRGFLNYSWAPLVEEDEPITLSRNVVHDSEVAFYMGDAITVTLIGNEAYGTIAAQVAITVNNSARQHVRLIGNVFRGGVVGVSDAGLVPSESPILEMVSNDIQGYSFLETAMRPEWTVVRPASEASIEGLAEDVLRAGASVFRLGSGTVVESEVLTVVSFDAVLLDLDEAWVVADPDRITIKKAGIYSLVGGVEWTAGAGARRVCDVLHNGNIVGRSDLTIPGDIMAQQATAVVECAVDDEIQLRLYQDSGDPVPVVIAQHSQCLSAMRISV